MEQNSSLNSIPEAHELEAATQLLNHGRQELSKIIAGQSSFIDQTLVVALCRGHALIEGVPGIAKTLVVKLLAQVLGLEFHRVQSTPDLMPADILGTNVFRSSSEEFVLHAGPVFTNFLLIDEINRMSPRTQSALLECMEERQVTIDRTRYPLPPAFTVFATQNPIDFEGTYPLPEAQLDRFLMKLRISYPGAEEEKTVLQRHHASTGPQGLESGTLISVEAGLLAAAQAEVRRVRIEAGLYDYIVAVVRRSREWPSLALGASPRAAVSLMLVAQGFAALEGRSYLVPDDVKQAALPVLRHRLILKPEAELEGNDTDRVITEILAAVPVPKRVISLSLIAEPQRAPAAPLNRFAFALTHRGLSLLLLGALWLIPAFFVHRLVWGVLIWDVIVLLFSLIDGFELSNPSRIEGQRRWMSVPSLESGTEVELSLTQRGRRIIFCRMMDDLPPAFLETPQWMQVTCYPNVPATVRYSFVPRARGDHAAGKLYLRYRSALGLLERWAIVDLTQTVRIYPSTGAGSAQSLFLARSRQIELQHRKQRQRGLGREFEALRDYRQGDDLRDVCWKASARRGALITKQYQTERSQPVWLLLDAGRLLQGRVGLYTKLDYATATALAMSQIALASGDRVGLLAYGRETQQLLAPARGSTHLRQIMESLALVRGESAEADHLRATVTLNRLQPRRSLVLWLTDPAETSMQPEVAEGAAQLMRRHLVLFVAMEQRDLRHIAGKRPENPQQMFAGAAAQEMIRWRELLLARLRQKGALTLETYPEEMTSFVLNRYLEIKERALL